MSKVRDSVENNKTETDSRNTSDSNDTAHQAEIDATQTGSGLNVDGTYTANGGANYIDTATSLKDADDKLDSQVKINTDDISSLTSSKATQVEMDATQTGAGLDTDGGYLTPSGTNYIDSTTSLSDADDTLDAQIKIVSDSVGTETTNRTNADTTIQSELNVTQTGAGLDTDGTYQANVGGNYISLATSLADADDKLDVALDSHESDTNNPHGTTAALVGADATGTAASEVSTHEGLSDPHTQYRKLFNYSIETTGITMVSGGEYSFDTSLSALSPNLPATPSIGDWVSISDYSSNFGTNNLTIGRNGSNIHGATSDLVLSSNNEGIKLYYIDSTKGWIKI